VSERKKKRGLKVKERQIAMMVCFGILGGI